MPTFEGCLQAREISLTRRGANPHAHVLMLKTLGPNGSPQPNKDTAMTDLEKAAAEKAASEARAAEINKAALAISKKIAGMCDVTRAHFLALPEGTEDAFLAKSAEDMKAEAVAAKTAADRVVAEEEARKAGSTVEVLNLTKTVAEQAEIIKGLQGDKVERDLEKRANSEFAGYPGGAAAVVPLLKAYATLPEDVRKASEAVLKAQCKTTAVAMMTFAGRTEEELTKAAGAQTRIDAAVEKYAAEHKVSKADAFEKVTEMSAFAEDVAAIG